MITYRSPAEIALEYVGPGDKGQAAMREIEALLEAEREACAKIAEDEIKRAQLLMEQYPRGALGEGGPPSAGRIRDAIRARNQK